MCGCVLCSHKIIIAFAHQHEVSDSDGRARATFNATCSREEVGIQCGGWKTTGTAKRLAPSFVEFVCFYFCLALTAAFTQPGARLSAEFGDLLFVWGAKFLFKRWTPLSLGLYLGLTCIHSCLDAEPLPSPLLTSNMNDPFYINP